MKLVLVLAWVAAAVWVVGCTTDREKPDGDLDAGAAAVVVAAAAKADVAADVAADVVADVAADVAADAGVQEVPLVSQQVDAGHMSDAQTARLNVVDGHAPVGGVDDVQSRIFNRLLVKVAPKDMPPTQMQAFVQEKTGQKIEKIRKTAGTFWLLQFAPVVPARTKAAQDDLVARLKATGAFVVVEGDQVMTLKSP